MDFIDQIIEREGGYVDHDADRGGCTNYGITLATLRAVRGDDSVDCNDVAALSEGEAREIYVERYIDEPGFAHIAHQELFGLVVDSGVQHGPSRAVKWLQEAAGVTADGIYGPVTTRAVNEADPHRLYRKVLARRVEFYGKIIALDPTQSAFALGWMRRVGEFVEATP